MKIILAALLLSITLPAFASSPLFDGGGPAVLAPSDAVSTITITGSGTKCFSADDPTLVVNCGTHLVSVGGSAGLSVTNTIAGSTVSLSLTGASNAGAFPYSPLMIFGNANTYLQSVMQNLSNGNNASSDFIFTNDLGGDSTFYLDIGINSSKFSQAGQTVEKSSSSFIVSSDSDLNLFADGNGTANGGNGLINLGSGGLLSANTGMSISSAIVSIPAQTGLKVTYGVTAGSVTVPNIVLTSTTAVFNVANVAIGTNTAADMLDVVGSAAGSLMGIATPSNSGARYSALMFYDSGIATSDFQIGQFQGSILGAGENGPTLRGLAAEPMMFWTNNSEKMRISSSGLVSIATTTSSTALTIYGVVTSSSTQGTLSCSAGTGVLTAACTDDHCIYAAGTGATNCTYTFGHVWPKTPVCICGTDAAVPIAVSATAATNTIKCTAAAALTGDNVSFICTGAP